MNEINCAAFSDGYTVKNTFAGEAFSLLYQGLFPAIQNQGKRQGNLPYTSDKAFYFH